MKITSSLTVAICIMCSFVTGCSSLDKQQTSFEPMANGSFHYRAFADATYPPTSAEAEEIRMEWLKQYINDNEVCKKGYQITDRKLILKRLGIIENLYDVIYTGNCTK